MALRARRAGAYGSLLSPPPPPREAPDIGLGHAYFT